MADRAAGLTALVLGSAAGGGFPQWNCACRQCRLARSGDPRVRAATQASVAFSGDGVHWLLVGASPDLRQQILTTPALQPCQGLRHSPITAVVLISADVDGIAGLLVLRERHGFELLAPRDILDVLAANSVFGVLDPDLVTRTELKPQEAAFCTGGMRVTLLRMPGKVPLYLESRGARDAEPGPSYAAMVEANGRRAVVAPACAEITESVREDLRSADLLFFDGTVFRDDEMVTAGVGAKTGRRMGHVPIEGEGGSLTRLGNLPGRRVFLHINNTNPILLADSPERRQVEAAGFEVAFDGMEIRV